MKKITFLIIATIMATISATAGTGWFDDFVTLKVNGVETPNNYYIGTNPGTGTAFDGAAFGTVTSLEMSDINLKYWADNGDARDGGALYYKIMSADGSTQIVAPFEIVWAHSSIGGNDYQGLKPGYVTGSMSFLRGLPTGSYQLHIWAKSWGAGGDSYLSNAGANYVATFSVVRPVTVSGTQSEIDNTYETLKAAFDAINTQTDYSNKNIEIKIAGNTTETATAALNQPTTASWTSLTIYPTAAATIEGSLDAQLIDLNGADNVTINGRINKNGTPISLTIYNQSNTSGARTIRLVNDAKTNTIQYCTIKGKGTSNGSGVIFFSTTTGADGNDGNIVEYNDINAMGAAAVGIGSAGTSTKDNSGNIIRYNNIFDFYLGNASTNATYGMYIGTANTDWTIEGNSIYQTLSRDYVATTAVTHMGLYVTNTSTGNNFIIKNNYIGGSSPNCVGTWTVSSGQSKLFAMQINVGSTIASSIQGNIIRNFDLTTVLTAASSTFIGLYLSAGSANIGNITANEIGSLNSNSSIRVLFTGAAANSLVIGSYINTGASSTVLFTNNKIGGIVADLNGSANRASLYGITTAGAGAATFSNNIIGSQTLTNNIELKGSTATSQFNLRGINLGNTVSSTISGNTIQSLTCTATGTATVNGIFQSISNHNYSNNIIRNIKSYGTRTSTGSTANLIGIAIVTNSTYNGQTISGNTIYNLSNENTTLGCEAYGIFLESGTTGHLIEKNKVYNILSSSSSTSAAISGIWVNAGSTVIKNNMVSLGNNIFTALNISGIKKSTTANNSIYHNTVVISGSEIGTAGTTTTAAFLKTASGTDELKNNILINSRSNATGNLQKHYVLNVNDLTTFTSDYNVAYHPGVGGLLGAVGATDYATGETWSAATPTGTGQDAGSHIGNVNFTDVANGDLTITGLSLQDNLLRVPSLATVTTDILGTTTRNASYTYAGAHESTLPFLTTGIDKALMQAGVQISKTGIFIPVNGTSNIELYTMNGTLIDKAVVNSSYSRSLNNGAYIVKINGKAVKFVK